MKKISMLPINTVVAPVRNGDPAILIADAAKAARELNWVPQFSNLDYILQTAWDQESVHIPTGEQKNISSSSPN